MSTQHLRYLSRTLILGALAGLTGGAAEIGWVSLYGALSGTPAIVVARGILAAVMPGWTPSSYAVSFGILIHLGLAATLGISLAFALRLLFRSHRRAHVEFGWVTLALATVWAVNFFALLPQVSPGFVHLLPLWTTLLSKLLFGFGAAAVFCAGRTPAPGQPSRAVSTASGSQPGP